MKHNEIKSFFKKRLQKELTQYQIEVLSIDETNSSKILYLVNVESLNTDYVLKCWFGTNDYSIRLYEGKDKINYFKDVIKEEKGTYTNLAPLGKMITYLSNYYQTK